MTIWFLMMVPLIVVILAFVATVIWIVITEALDGARDAQIAILVLTVGLLFAVGFVGMCFELDKMESSSGQIQVENE